MALKTEERKLRYNAYSKRQNRDVYHFPSNKARKSSFNAKYNPRYSNVRLNLNSFFVISEEVEREYKVYKLKRENRLKSKYRNYSFYEDDGSVDYIRVFKSLFSNHEGIRTKAFNILMSNVRDFLNDDMIIDWIALIFSYLILIYILSSVFINVPSILEYKLSIIM